MQSRRISHDISSTRNRRQLNLLIERRVQTLGASTQIRKDVGEVFQRQATRSSLRGHEPDRTALSYQMH